MTMTLIKSDFDTPAGRLTLVTQGDTVLICEFADRQERVNRHLARHYGGVQPEYGTTPANVAAGLARYFRGDLSALDALVSTPKGTDFEKRVWKALRAIPAGQTLSYGALAERLGSSPRAIGGANGRNPVCLVHPCHRVIGANGTLTGYAGGLERKAWLLAHEGALHAS